MWLREGRYPVLCLNLKLGQKTTLDLGTSGVGVAYGYCNSNNVTRRSRFCLWKFPLSSLKSHCVEFVVRLFLKIVVSMFCLWKVPQPFLKSFCVKFVVGIFSEEGYTAFLKRQNTGNIYTRLHCFWKDKILETFIHLSFRYLQHVYFWNKWYYLLQSYFNCVRRAL